MRINVLRIIKGRRGIIPEKPFTCKSSGMYLCLIGKIKEIVKQALCTVIYCKGRYRIGHDYQRFFHGIGAGQGCYDYQPHRKSIICLINMTGILAVEFAAISEIPVIIQ